MNITNLVKKDIIVNQITLNYKFEMKFWIIAQFAFVC